MFKGVGLVPVGDPLAGVAGRVVQPVRTQVGRVPGDGSQPRHLTGPPPQRISLAPGHSKPQGTSGRFFPLGLGGQFLPRPRGVGLGLGPTDASDWFVGRSPFPRGLGNSAFFARVVPIGLVLPCRHFHQVDIEALQNWLHSGAFWFRTSPRPQVAGPRGNQSHQRPVGLAADSPRKTILGLPRFGNRDEALGQSIVARRARDRRSLNHMMHPERGA